jgi:hypothetical protein
VPANQNRLFADHNVSMRTVERLRRLRFVVETAKEHKLDQKSDESVLLVAVQQGAVLLTHDEEDFTLLFQAWHRWSNTWGVRQNHGGIVTYPQVWTDDFAVPCLVTLLGQRDSFQNCLVRYRPSRQWLISLAADESTWP